MLRMVLVVLAAAGILGCSSGVSHTMEKPIDEVRAMVQANERSLMLTHYLPGAGHKSELLADGMQWRFTLNDRDYARMVITLDAKNAQSTAVSTRFEEVNDAAGPGVKFLRETARATSQEILTATLEGRPINHALLQDQFKIQAAKDPLAVGGMAQAYMEESARMFKEIQANGGAFSATSGGSAGGTQPYDKQQPYDRTPAYDRN